MSVTIILPLLPVIIAGLVMGGTALAWTSQTIQALKGIIIPVVWVLVALTFLIIIVRHIVEKNVSVKDKIIRLFFSFFSAIVAFLTTQLFLNEIVASADGSIGFPITFIIIGMFWLWILVTCVMSSTTYVCQKRYFAASVPLIIFLVIMVLVVMLVLAKSSMANLMNPMSLR